MSRVQLVNPANTTPDRKALLDQIHGAFGASPNMFKAVANSPAALHSMWASFGALGAGVSEPFQSWRRVPQVWMVTVKGGY